MESVLSGGKLNSLIPGDQFIRGHSLKLDIKSKPTQCLWYEEKKVVKSFLSLKQLGWIWAQIRKWVTVPLTEELREHNTNFDNEWLKTEGILLLHSASRSDQETQHWKKLFGVLLATAWTSIRKLFCAFVNSVNNSQFEYFRPSEITSVAVLHET